MIRRASARWAANRCSLVPLSLVTGQGGHVFRRCGRAREQRGMPESERSTIRARHSRVKSSNTASTQNIRPQARRRTRSRTTSADQAPVATPSAPTCRSARLLPPSQPAVPRHRAGKASFLWFSMTPSGRSSTCRRRCPNRPAAGQVPAVCGGSVRRPIAWKYSDRFWLTGQPARTHGVRVALILDGPGHSQPSPSGHQEFFSASL